MPKLTDTYARAYDCCDQVFTELGRFPTIDLIRERIGVNSPVTIKKAMNEWTRHFAERHFDKLNRPDIPVVLTQAMEQAWQLAVLEAEQAYVQKEQGYKQSLAEAQATIGLLQQERELMVQTLGEAREHLERAEQKLLAFQQQVDGLAQDNRRLEEQVETSGKQLAEHKALLAEQAQRWQERQEQDQAWFARRISEEKQFSEEKWQEKLQRQQHQIAALTESETVLRQTCVGLRQEQQRLLKALADSGANGKIGYGFRARANQGAGQQKLGKGRR